MTELTPSLVGCLVAADNHSFELARSSRECVTDLLTMALQLVGIGNYLWQDIDKIRGTILNTYPNTEPDVGLERQ